MADGRSAFFVPWPRPPKEHRKGQSRLSPRRLGEPRCGLSEFYRPNRPCDSSYSHGYPSTQQPRTSRRRSWRIGIPQAPTHQLPIRAKCSSHRLSANMLKRHSLTSPRPLKGPSGSRSGDQPLDAIEFLPCAAVAANGELVFTGQQKTQSPDILTEMGGLTVAVLNTSQTPVL